MVFAIHWHESAMGVHVFPILNPSLTSLSIPQGHPSAPALSTLSHASNLDWQSVPHMVIYMFQCYSLKLSHPHLQVAYKTPDLKGLRWFIKRHDKCTKGYGIVVVVSSLSHVWLFCYPVACSPPGSFVHGISQERTLEWVATSFSSESSRPRVKSMSPALVGRIFITEPAGKP